MNDTRSMNGTMNNTNGTRGGGRGSRNSTSPADFAIGDEIIVVEVVLFTFATLIFLARFYVRARIIKAIGVDDWIMLVAQVLSTTTCICFVNAVKLGLGRRMSAIPEDNFRPLLQWLFFYSMTALLALTAVKVSIAFHLLRLTQGIRYKKFLESMIVILITTAIAFALVIVFQCTPIEGAWDPRLQRPPRRRGNRKCMNIATFNNTQLISSAIIVITDVIFALLPIPLIWTLKVGMRIKISLTIVLGLGFFACAAGVTKMYHQLNFFQSGDPFGQVKFFEWQIVELNIAIIAASLPTIKPLLKWALTSVGLIKERPRSQFSAARPPLRRRRNINLTLGSLRRTTTPGTTKNDVELAHSPGSFISEEAQQKEDERYLQNHRASPPGRL